MTIPVTLLEDYQERLSHTHPRDGGPNDIKDEMPYLLGAASGYTHCRVLELGVRGGRSTSAFLAAAARTGGHVWSVDVNAPQVPDAWHKCGYWTFKQADDADFDLEDEGWPASYNVLFIDTSHEYDRTVAELRKFIPYVAPGGVALFHDTKLPGLQVARALDDFCAESGMQWMERGGWYGLGVIEKPNG